MTGQSWPGQAGERHALVVANADYRDPGLKALRAPAADADALARVLSDPAIGGFEVQTVIDQPAHVIAEAVEEFFVDRSPDDLLLVHFSCHGVKDEDGELYFAATNTKLRLLGATALAANFVNRKMNQSRSRRIVLFLDCCYAGAFQRGMAPRAGTELDLQERFGGRGRAVITASGALEYAFEDQQLAEGSEPQTSVFTTAMVRGLASGEADRDQDGYVGLDELYDYVYDAVRSVTTSQTPSKWTFGVQGDLQLARRSGPVAIPVPLPAELQESVDSPLAGVRFGAVHELQLLLSRPHPGRALGARLALERLTDDDSRMVAAAATAALAESPPAEPPAESPPAEPPPPVALPIPEPVQPTRPSAVPPSTQASEPADQPVDQPADQSASSRGWAAYWARRRALIAGLAAVVLLVGGFLSWRLLSGPDADSNSETLDEIPAGFAGAWNGSTRIPSEDDAAVTYRVVFVAGSHSAQLREDEGNTSCGAGVLRLKSATASVMTMSFVPKDNSCTPGTATLTLRSADDKILLHMRPDEGELQEDPYDATLGRD